MHVAFENLKLTKNTEYIPEKYIPETFENFTLLEIFAM